MINALPRVAIAVHDFEAAMATFHEKLGHPVVDFSARTVPDLGAHVGLCIPPGGSNIEIMAPANPDLPLSQSLQKFLDRRGDGLYALMLEAADPNAEAAELEGRGLTVLGLMKGASGRDIHPSSTHGVLIRVYPDGSVRDQGPQVLGPPQLSGITRVVIATADAATAAAAYRDALGLATDPMGEDADRGVRYIRCHPPRGGTIELVSVIDATRPFAAEVQRFTKDDNEGMFALVLETADPQAAAKILVGRGLEVGNGLGMVETSLFGARILVE